MRGNKILEAFEGNDCSDAAELHFRLSAVSE